MHCFNDDTLNSLLLQVIRLHYIRSHTLMGEHGLYRGQAPIMGILWKKDGLTQRELSEKLHLKPATITVMLRRMEKAGHLERRADPQDLRVSRVYLTESGRKIQLEVEEALKRIEDECFEGFTMEEKVLLRRFFIQIKSNLLKGANFNMEE